MASKQQQLRAMMKKAQQTQASENMSAIEKARLMKMLRKKQKEESELQQAQQQQLASNQGFAVPAAPKDRAVASQKKVVSTTELTSKAPTGLPPGFFDSDSSQQPVSRTAPVQPAPILAAAYGDDSENEDVEDDAAQHPQAQAAEIEDSSVMPGLPKGFFDNPQEEVQVRQTYSGKSEQQDQTKNDDALKAFLTDVNQVEVAEEDEATPEDEAEEENWQELEQMAYQSRLAKLLFESEQVLHKRKHQRNDASQPVVTSDAIENMLEEVQEAVITSRATEGEAQVQQVQDLIQQGLTQRKKKKSKHDANADMSDGTLPLELFDWRARAL